MYHFSKLLICKISRKFKIMKDDYEKDVQLIQTNRFISEWESNLALEQETRNRLGQKHREEHQALSLKETDYDQRALLIATHLQEIMALKQQHAIGRKAIEMRQIRETAMLTDQFNSTTQYQAIQVNRLSAVNRRVYSVMVHA